MNAIIENFGGPGGWKAGLALLGRHDAVAVELDSVALATSRAAGFATVQADVSALDPADFASERGWTGEGYIASPPCGSFSLAGKGTGRADLDLLLSATQALAQGSDPGAVLAALRITCCDQRTPLVMEPLRWIQALRPSWVALEQVPSVLPLWEAFARVLRPLGYHAATGCVQAETLGVPQTRRRAILVASLAHPVALPVATHSRYYPRDPERLDSGVTPWVSMATALGRGMNARPSMTVTGGGTAAGGAEPFGNAARQGMVREISAGRWYFRGGPVSPLRITVPEAATLQTFPDGYPWQGNQGQMFRQIGDAVPPLLAAHVLQAAGAGVLTGQLALATGSAR